MPIEIYLPFKNELLQILSRYQEKERFREDCLTIQCMINDREYRGKPLNGVYPLIQAIENYCQHELCSNTKPLFFYWTRTIQTKNNDLYIDLKRVMTRHFEAALIWENEKYRVILESNPTTSDVLRLTDRNQQLEKELVAMTIRVDQAEENNEVKNDHIEELLKENARLNQKVKFSSTFPTLERG